MLDDFYDNYYKDYDLLHPEVKTLQDLIKNDIITNDFTLTARYLIKQREMYMKTQLKTKTLEEIFAEEEKEFKNENIQY